MESTISGILGPAYRSAPAVLVTPRGADAHQQRMNAMRSIRIPLHSRKYSGLHAIVDEEDAELVNQYRWHPVLIRGEFYAATSDGYSRLYLHRLITGAKRGFDVDHINGTGLDNRRENLRVCTHAQNQRNLHRTKPSKSGFRGVWPANSKWSAIITASEKRRYLGVFVTPEDAARAYDTAARELFGQFGTYNFPQSGERSALTGEIEP